MSTKSKLRTARHSVLGLVLANLFEPLEERLSGYFHFFGLRGGLLMQLGRNEEARVAFDRAIALANTAAEAAHIRMHIDRLIKESAEKSSVQKVR